MKKILKQNYITSNDILVEPNDILKEKSTDVKIPLDKDDEKILRIMYNHVSNSQHSEYSEKYNIRAAVGIAAIQIGVAKKMLAIKTIDENEMQHKYMLVNPKYIKKSEQMAYLRGGEGCLSVEEGKYSGLIPRHYHIVVEAYNLFSKSVETIELEGYIAIVLQHEMDHLEGKLYFEKINKLDPNFKQDDWIEI